jgi:hypothetical protein
MLLPKVFVHCHPPTLAQQSSSRGSSRTRHFGLKYLPAGRIGRSTSEDYEDIWPTHLSILWRGSTRSRKLWGTACVQTSGRSSNNVSTSLWYMSCTPPPMEQVAASTITATDSRGMRLLCVAYFGIIGTMKLRSAPELTLTRKTLFTAQTAFPP